VTGWPGRGPVHTGGRAHRPAGRETGGRGAFGALGLVPGRGLTDDDVRAAWRRIAAATHPDRDDGGDPERFAGAAAAYTALRTPSGRGEALADLLAARDSGRPPERRRRLAAGRAERAGRWKFAAAPAGFAVRVRSGRPGRLLLRAAVAVAVGAAAVAAAGWHPATVALITGALTWLGRTGRQDLAPPNWRSRRDPEP